MVALFDGPGSLEGPVTLGVVLGGLLLLRRRWPVAVLAASVVAVVALRTSELTDAGWIWPASVAYYTAAAQGRPRWAVAIGLAELSRPDLGGLAELVASARAAGLDVSLREDGDPASVPAPVALAAYRVVQEALTNTLKHACARRVTVELGCRPAEVVVEVVDDGRGAPGTPAAGLGLVGMRERVTALGGSLRAGPERDGGFRVRAAILPDRPYRRVVLPVVLIHGLVGPLGDPRVWDRLAPRDVIALDLLGYGRYAGSVGRSVNVEGNFTLADAFWSGQLARQTPEEVAQGLARDRGDPAGWLRGA